MITHMTGHTTCSNCDTTAPNDGASRHPDWGLSFQARLFGHYSGFYDYYGEGSDEWFFLCHDCSVLMYETMAGLARKIMPMTGGHPNLGWSYHEEKDGTKLPPCCKWCWTWVKIDGLPITYIVGENGEWVRAYDEVC